MRAILSLAFIALLLFSNASATSLRNTQTTNLETSSSSYFNDHHKSNKCIVRIYEKDKYGGSYVEGSTSGSVNVNVHHRWASSIRMTTQCKLTVWDD